MELVVHAGAGSPREPEEALGVQRTLVSALEAGARKREAMSAALAAIEILEDYPLLNAGRGSARASNGEVYMDASAMDSLGNAGAVCGMSRLRHPSKAAAGLLEEEMVLWQGSEEELAGRLGLEVMDEDWFKAEPSDVASSGTVGAVALDEMGGLFAVTSTGGYEGKHPARVGDSAIIGAGTWCSGLVAVSCTGAGEAFMQSLAAFQVERRLGDGLIPSARSALRDAQACGGEGGIIAVSSDGQICAERTSQAMQWAALSSGQISFGD